MTIDEIRRRNVLHLVDTKCGGNIAEFGRKYDVSEKYVRLIKGEHSKMGGNFARDLERALARVHGGDWHGWIDVNHGFDLDPEARQVAQDWITLDDPIRASIAATIKSLADAKRVVERPTTPEPSPTNDAALHPLTHNKKPSKRKKKR